MAIIDTLLEKFPIRKTKAQKEDFRAWFLEEAAAMGYEAKVEKKHGSSNVIAGDPETAQVTFTAHYDTPPVLPLPNCITPKNILIYILYQMLMVIVIVGIGLIFSLLAGWLTKDPMIAYFTFLTVDLILSALMMFGPANQNNANDNTSGVAAVMELMQKLPMEERAKAAFILFDNEEKGLLGSSAYASAHKEVYKNRLIINLDCVGDGEHIFFFANKKTRKRPDYALLEEAVNAQEGRIPHMEKMEQCVYPSDQNNFKNGLAVCACNKGKVLGYYVNKIHTAKDTVCDQSNLDFLRESLTRFVQSL